jgi:hypothetical protein
MAVIQLALALLSLSAIGLSAGGEGLIYYFSQSPRWQEITPLRQHWVHIQSIDRLNNTRNLLSHAQAESLLAEGSNPSIGSFFRSVVSHHQSKWQAIDRCHCIHCASCNCRKGHRHISHLYARKDLLSLQYQLTAITRTWIAQDPTNVRAAATQVLSEQLACDGPCQSLRDAFQTWVIIPKSNTPYCRKGGGMV